MHLQSDKLSLYLFFDLVESDCRNFDIKRRKILNILIVFKIVLVPLTISVHFLTHAFPSAFCVNIIIIQFIL
jgi:hypothetical protein